MLAAAQEPIILEAFPKGTKIEKQRFELLRKAYVDARYDKNYTITKAELKWLAVESEKIAQINGENLQEKDCKFYKLRFCMFNWLFAKPISFHKLNVITFVFAGLVQRFLYIISTAIVFVVLNVCAAIKKSLMVICD